MMFNRCLGSTLSRGIVTSTSSSSSRGISLLVVEASSSARNHHHLLCCLSAPSYSAPQRSSAALIQSLASAAATRRSFSSETSNYLGNYSPEKVNKIEAMDKKLRFNHKELEKTLGEKDLDEVRRKRMIYRSKQRGWLEADILLGSWAKEHVPKLSSLELDELDVVLQEETIDIYNYVSGKDELPDRLKALSVMKSLQSYALNKDMVGPSAYESVKREANLT